MDVLIFVDHHIAVELATRRRGDNRSWRQSQFLLDAWRDHPADPAEEDENSACFAGIQYGCRESSPVPTLRSSKIQQQSQRVAILRRGVVDEPHVQLHQLLRVGGRAVDIRSKDLHRPKGRRKESPKGRIRSRDGQSNEGHRQMVQPIGKIHQHTVARRLRTIHDKAHNHPDRRYVCNPNVYVEEIRGVRRKVWDVRWTIHAHSEREGGDSEKLLENIALGILWPRTIKQRRQPDLQGLLRKLDDQIEIIGLCSSHRWDRR